MALDGCTRGLVQNPRLHLELPLSVGADPVFPPESGSFQPPGEPWQGFRVCDSVEVMSLRPMPPVDVPEPTPPRPLRERVYKWSSWLMLPIIVVASLTGISDNMHFWQKLLALLGVMWIINESTLGIAHLLHQRHTPVTEQREEQH